MGFLKRLFGGGPEPAVERSAGDDAGLGGDVGIFAGLFVASRDAVDAWDIDTCLTPVEWPAIEFKHLDTVKLGNLESILTGVPYDDIDQGQLHNLVREGGAEGPWIALLRQPLIDALASVDDSRISAAGAAWADTDEFKARPTDKPSRANIEDLAVAISEMAGLARVSKERGDPMLLMMGL